MVNIMVKEYTWSDGSKYVGEFKEGLPNGQGTLTSPDGRKYVGEFKDRKKHGQGTETLFTIGQPSSLVQISFSTRTF